MSQPIPDEDYLVLIAESTADFHDRYQTMLEQAGYAVAVVSYDEAAASSRTMRPSLIILQVADLARSGLGLVRELRTQPETRGTPVVTLVRFDDAHTREQIVRAGASAILIDPVKRPALLRQLRRLLARALASGSSSAPTSPLPSTGASAEVSRG